MTKYHPLIRFNIQPDKEPDNTAEINRIAQLKKELEGVKDKIRILNTEKKTIESKNELPRSRADEVSKQS